MPAESPTAFTTMKAQITIRSYYCECCPQAKRVFWRMQTGDKAQTRLCRFCGEVKFLPALGPGTVKKRPPSRVLEDTDPAPLLAERGDVADSNGVVVLVPTGDG